MVSALRSSSVCLTHAALRLASVRCVFIKFCQWERTIPVSGLTPIHWAPTTIRLRPVRCIPIAIRFSSVHHVLTANGLFPIFCEVSSCRLPVVSSYFMLANTKLFSHRISQLLGDPACGEAGEHELCTLYNFGVITLLTMEYFPREICSWIGSSILVACWRVLVIFQGEWMRTFNLWVTCFRMTQLSPPSSSKLLSGGATT